MSRLPPPWRGCGASEHVFFRPGQKLKASGKYTLRVTIADKGPGNIGSFTVGDSVSVREVDVHPEITYLKVFTSPGCAGEQCFDFANLLVDLGQPPGQPLWLRLRGSYTMQNTHGWTFYPRGWSEQADQPPQLLSAIQLSVPLASDDDCVDIQLYGVEGRRLFEERRCQPDRCAVYTIVAATSSGGRPGGSPVKVEQIPDGSCDDPPVLNDGVGGMIDPAAAGTAARLERDAGPASYTDDASAPAAAGAKPPTPKERAANGCGAASQRSADFPASLLVTLLALATLVLRRRRMARSLLQ